jgi:predicted transposase/invertase (TIGR01784 family)
MKKIQFSGIDDIADICADGIFKAVFTKNTPESRGALRLLLSAFLERELSAAAVSANEPPIDSLEDRQIRYDISVIVDDDELVDLEMTRDPQPFEPLRQEYYAIRLYITQHIKGQDKSYRNLERAYQISIVVNKSMFDDNALVHHFEYYDKEHRVNLGGRTMIITLELSKTVKLLTKSVTEMTALERWAIFFRYTADKSKRALINELLAVEEGIAMAGAAILTISKEQEDAILQMKMDKYELDRQSDIVEARREAREEARKEMWEEARKQARQQMEAVARKMKQRGNPPEQIAEDTGLSVEEIARL